MINTSPYQTPDFLAEYMFILAKKSRGKTTVFRAVFQPLVVKSLVEGIIANGTA